MEGHVNIHRTIMDWRWYTTPNMHHLFEHLIMRANFKEGAWHGTTIKRGELITSRAKLSRETGLSEKQIRLGLERLKKTGEIIIESTNNYSLITICNYDRYQGASFLKGQRGATSRPTEGLNRATIEERDKGIRTKIDSSLHSESSSSATTSDDSEINFLAFMDFFNRTMQENGAQIPTITDMTSKRQQAVRARAKEHSKEALRKAVINAATAPFLNGAGDKAWVADFNWIFRPVNFIKVLEGSYNHAVVNQNPISHGTENNNGYRSREDMLKGTVQVMSELITEGRQPKKPLPVV